MSLVQIDGAPDMAQTRDPRAPLVVDTANLKPARPTRPSLKTKRSSRKSSRRSRTAPLPPYSDDPTAVYLYAADLEEQRETDLRPAPLRDALVIIFQLALLLVIGLMCLHWYGAFAEEWRAANAGRFVEEVLRRERLIVSRGLTV